MFALFTVVLSSAAALVSKYGLVREHAMEFATIIAAVNAIILLPILFTIDYSAIPGVAYALISLVAIFGAMAYLFVFKSVRHLPISVSSPLLAIVPALGAITGFLILEETLQIHNIAGLLFVIAGVYVLEHERGISLWKNLVVISKQKYVQYILIAAILYTFSGTIDRYLLSPTGITISPLEYLAMVHFLIAMIFFFLLTFFYDGIDGVVNGLKKAWIAIFLVALLTLGYRYMQTMAFSMADGKLALVEGIKRSSVLVTTIVGGMLFHELNVMRHSFAALIIILGVFLLII